MNLRLGCALTAFCIFCGELSAQTIRFDTNVGTFDMLLNPTENPNLQAHVDNVLSYVQTKRYDRTVINRAATGFVLQMGGFQANTLSLPTSFDEFPAVQAFDAVVVDSNSDGNVDFDVTGLTNTRSTVSLALSAGNLNSGTSSFFVNLSDTNTFLDDSGFVPFAEIENMDTIDLIMSLGQQNLDPTGQNLGAINIPVLEDDHLVIIERAFVVDTQNPSMSASDVSSSSTGSASTAAELAAEASPLSSASLASSPVTTSSLHSVPEPPALVVAVGALMFVIALKRHQIA